MGYQSEYFKYQWRLNGTEIFGANNKTLDISSANEIQAEVYDCIVTNQWNDTSVSAPAQLTITSTYLLPLSKCMHLYRLDVRLHLHIYK